MRQYKNESELRWGDVVLDHEGNAYIFGDDLREIHNENQSREHPYPLGDGTGQGEPEPIKAAVLERKHRKATDELRREPPWPKPYMLIGNALGGFDWEKEFEERGRWG